MKILYLTQRFDIKNRGIQTDLLCALADHGHEITIVACENKEKTFNKSLHKLEQFKVVYVPVSNQFGVSTLRKGIVQLTIPIAMIRTIQKHLSSNVFELVLYATPPVTLAPVVKYCKKKFNCKSFLALKDIFPQNAVDLGMMRKGGIIYTIFKKIEHMLYDVSDQIGCTSEGNIRHILKHNPQVKKSKIILFPNTIYSDSNELIQKKREILDKYGIPQKSVVFIFAGNLGKPQAINLLLSTINKLKNNNKGFFLILGKGTEYFRIQNYLVENNCSNAKIIPFIPSYEYVRVLRSCDVGLILLNPTITVPNTPEKLTSYMANGIPILAATDSATDIKDILKNANCGYWCSSNDENSFIELVQHLCKQENLRLALGLNGREFYKKNLTVDRSVSIIERFISMDQSEQSTLYNE